MGKQYRHGDLLLEQVESIPQGGKIRKTDIILEGETTGHAHRVAVADRPKVELVEVGDCLFVRATSPATIVHEEHTGIELPAGSYRVTRQREYDPYEEAARDVQD